MENTRVGKFPTIRHVAAEAGVSYQTVSRVINNSPNVKTGVRARVQAAIAKLGYVPSAAARNMGGRRSYLIVAINDRVRTIDNWQSGRGNDWVDQMLFGGMLECEKHGYRMAFELAETDTARALQAVKGIVSALQPDGVILTPPHSENPALGDMLRENRTVFARLNARGDARGINVYMDDEAAADSAVRHLTDMGHNRIGFIGGNPAYAASDLRLKGYRTAMTATQCAPEGRLEAIGDFSYASGLKAAIKLFDASPPPTAIIAGNDEMAIAVLHAAAQRHLSVPHDLSIISFDDSPSVRFSVPPLTAIRQPISDMTACAARELIARCDGNDMGEAEFTDFVLPYALIARTSTGPAPS